MISLKQLGNGKELGQPILWMRKGKGGGEGDREGVSKSVDIFLKTIRNMVHNPLLPPFGPN